MKVNEIILKFERQKSMSSVFTINGREFSTNNPYKILMEVYNEMFGENLTFDDIIKRYISSSSNEEAKNL